MVTTEFCLLEDIEKEGFIYPDGSLKFELEIEKHNYRKKLSEAEEKLKMLEEQLEIIKAKAEVVKQPCMKSQKRSASIVNWDNPLPHSQPVEKIRVGAVRPRDDSNVANDVGFDPLVASNSPAKRKRRNSQ